MASPEPVRRRPTTAGETTAENPWPVRLLAAKMDAYIAKMPWTWVEGQVVQVNDRPGSSVVFVTAYTDDATLERIREVVPGSPILAKPVYRERLAAAVAEVVH